jgi:hypothetical protein
MTKDMNDLEKKTGKLPGVFKRLAETDPYLHEMILKLDQ